MSKKKTVAKKDLTIVLVKEGASFLFDADKNKPNEQVESYKVNGLCTVINNGTPNLAILARPDTFNNIDNVCFPLVDDEEKWPSAPTNSNIDIAAANTLDEVVNLTKYYEYIEEDTIDKIKKLYKNAESDIPVRRIFSYINDNGDSVNFEGYIFKRTIFLII